jgi:photosystem II stability/assembly factor-like uncharacterized protein
MKITNTRVPLTFLSLVGTYGMALAIHAGLVGSRSTAIISSKAPGGSPSSQWHWQNPLPQGNNLRGASFVDATTGTVVGEYGTIVRTTDGGNSWTIQGSGTTQTLWAVSFTDANNGTAVGEGGTIVRTTDGGTHWTSQASGTAFQFRGVSFSDTNNGAAVGESGTILRTTDGGNSWVPQSSGTANMLFGVSFIDANTGTAVGGSCGIGGESTI